MGFRKILIANRAEIAIRIARATSDLGIGSVAIFSEDDTASMHTRVADESIALAGVGAPAYLDMDRVIQAALTSGCDAIHPGYGFLSEQAEFANRCTAAGITFIGPEAAHLALFGDKTRARAAAMEAGVPLPRGINRAVTVAEAREFLASLGPDGGMMIKAVAGGGGRGTSAVLDASDLENVFARCQREAQAAFGIGDVYVEEFLARARHIEVQVLADKQGNVTHLGERECSIQRRNQKVIEIAPAPGLPENVRDAMIDAAVRFARHEHYSNLGTFEFLLDASGRDDGAFVFIEANARLQVEHTVTEAVTGVDIVQAQIRLAEGASLSDLGLDSPEIFVPRGYAIQARVNMETFKENGQVRPASGTFSAYEVPGGPGIRVDGFGYTGYQTSTAFDSLLAKVIVHSAANDFKLAANRASRALSEFRIEGVGNNLSFLRNILDHDAFVGCDVHTRWVDEQMASLVVARKDVRYQQSPAKARPRNTKDPLALFAHDASVKSSATARSDVAPALAPVVGPSGSTGMSSPIQGTLVSIDVVVSDEVRQGQQVAVVEAMKMEHVIASDRDGIVREITMAVGEVVREGYPIVFIEDAQVTAADVAAAESFDPDYIRPDLAEMYDRRAYTLDENRKDAVAKRYARGYRMPRENIAELVDPGSFKEYWPLVVAKQHLRYDMETLRRDTPADGLVAGTATINADLFGEQAARAMVVHYDYTVLAGTQGTRNHYKQDRLFELAHRFRLPLVLFGEGGGGRPGDDSDGPRVWFDVETFSEFSKLSGLVPLVAVINGRTFAGNTALVAACDVIIATEGSTVAMGGPAMIEGGGLGIYTPEEVGSMSFQVPNGVVDILVRDEADAVQVAKKYLSYFQGSVGEWTAPDQRALRHAIPENRLRLYDMRQIINTIADVDSVLEIREKFGIGVITAFIRVEGRPMGVVANNPHHLAGAIDSNGADKGARFMHLCDAFDIPMLSLMDCPGIMVGPDVEKTALVRHALRMFNVGANLTTSLFSVVVRKGYGLGVQAMSGGGSLIGFFTVAWPTAEFSGMNIEGGVKLGYRKDLAAITDPEERARAFEKQVARDYDDARAVNAATGGGVDDVIDPADTRDWIASSLKRLPPVPPRQGKKYPYIDPW